MPDNVATVHELYARFQRGDVPAILEMLHPDVVWEHDAVDHGIPWLRPGRGREHVAGFFGALAGLEFHAFAPEAILADAHHVGVFVRHDLTVRATGKRLTGVELHYWTFDAEGRIIAMKHFVDTLAHRDAAG